MQVGACPVVFTAMVINRRSAPTVQTYTYKWETFLTRHSRRGAAKQERRSDATPWWASMGDKGRP